jgi:rhodanese-related sulfurtransferase
MSLPFPLTERRAKAFGRALNFAIAATALLLAGVLAKSYFSGTTQAKAIVPGARLPIAGVDWSRADHTLLLALRKDCDFSARSVPFYRRLVQSFEGRGDIRLIALSPHDASEGRAYLNELGLPVSEIMQSPINSLGIHSLPTLALLNRDGIVSDVWIGQLTPSREAEVMDRLGLKDPRPMSQWVMDAEELERRVARREPVALLDLRERAAFARSHPARAKNIPLDELSVRAVNELSPADTVVLHDDDSSRAESAYTLLVNQGFARVFVLRERPPAR